jgi:hypothetical protein
VIDERALVSPQAELAADVSVGPFSVIGPQVRIGARTRIAAHVVINGPTTIGADIRRMDGRGNAAGEAGLPGDAGVDELDVDMRSWKPAPARSVRAVF